MDDPLLTSGEAGDLLGVGATTIKRWADTGLLRCFKTAGSHRRFLRSEVEALRGHRREEASPAVADGGPWIRLLTSDASPLELQAELLTERARRGSWWQVADALGTALETLGSLWRQGKLTILEEHLASERIARALSRAGESLPARRSGPRCLLGVPEGEEHTLGLSLAELALREAGWTTCWAGRSTPLAELVAALEARRAEMLVLSSSGARVRPRQLGHDARLLAGACRASGARLVLGGRGAWPELPGVHRLHTFGELADLLRTC